jgi:hypothetical protein
VMVAWSGCRTRPRTYTPGLRRITRQPQPLAVGLPDRMPLYCDSVTPFGWSSPRIVDSV